MPRLAEGLRRPLTRRFQRSLAQIIDRTAPTVQRMWDGLDDYDEDSIEILTARSSSAMAAAKATASRQAAGYYTVLAGVRPPPITPSEVTATAAMRDPFISYWQALAGGHPFDEAVAIGRSRTEAVVVNLVNSSARQTGDLVVAKANIRVAGWERITDEGACEWCISVADQHYATADTADFGHDRCACTTAPLFT